MTYRPGMQEGLVDPEDPPQSGTELPVGSVYINATDPTDPAVLLGYGTWEPVDPGVWLRAI